MVQWTAPSSLLVEHPALPLPVVDGDHVQPEVAGAGSAPRLGRRGRIQLACQLTALTSLLAEFDLWPGRRHLMAARVVETGSGLQAVVGGFPRSLTRVYRGLGGGERAADVMRGAARRAIMERTGVGEDSFGVDEEGPGFGLEGALEALLGEQPRPLDALTAGNLWAERWDLPPAPVPGEAQYWRVPSERIGRRLATALWAALRAQGRPAWLRLGGGAGRGEGPAAPVAGGGVLLVAGRFSEEDLAAVGRWAEQPGCAAAALGVFPAGWQPPPPPGGFDPLLLPQHLGLSGAAAQRCREELRRRQGIFNPAGEADRVALTEAARWLWDVPQDAGEGAGASPVSRCLQLLPDGLPLGFVEVHTGLSGAALRDACPDAAVVVDGDRWRLAQPAPLTRDPMHSAVAETFAPSDPRRLRHRALADGDPCELVAHCEERLSRLEGGAVRELLAPIAPGSLGEVVRHLLVEACLSELDLAGARNALEGADEERAAPWKAWLEVVDAPGGFAPTLPGASSVAAAPRAAAEVALAVLRRALRTGSGDVDSALEVIETCRRVLAGPLRRRFELETAAMTEPMRLQDRGWRERVVAGHPALQRRCLHLQGLRLTELGRAAAARRILRWALRGATSPGEQGLLHLDLGYLGLDVGRTGVAATHLLRALRLLEAAGFEQRTQAVLFNLAVCDVDVLEVQRAERRLDELEGRASPGGDPFVTGERVRLALAVGDEGAFRHRLARFPVAMAAVDARFEEQLALLRGVEALLGGELDGARRLLRRGGAEGRPWLGILEGLEGREPEEQEGENHWGLPLAAALVRLAVSGRPAEARSLVPAGRPPGLPESLALALTERLLGRQSWIDDDLRRSATRRLERAGLSGWGRQLAGWTAAADAMVGGLAAVVDRGNPEGVDDVVMEKMLGALGLTGIEVRQVAGGTAIWRWGRGDAAGSTTCGHLLVAPLGGQPASAHGWRLLTGVLELLLPDWPTPDAEDEEGTGLYGRSEAMCRLRDDLRGVAPTGVEVLLVGETGVGKEVAAHALHTLSGRRGRFVPVNVAAVPSALLEAELFGAVRGAYTGADRSRAGLAEAAAGGTLFLDEIGDLDLPLQVKLLRFLESREVRPVGSDRFRQADVRIVAATHRDLKRRMREGSFRADLYYRITAMPIVIPPLRQRLEDIPVLRARFQREGVAGKGLRMCRWGSAAEEALLRYRWPGNVRELRHVVEVAMVRAAGGTVHPRHLHLEDGMEMPAGRWDQAMADYRRRFLGAALRRNRGNRSATARELGISRQALLYQIRALGLKDESG